MLEDRYVFFMHKMHASLRETAVVGCQAEETGVVRRVAG